MSASLNAKKKTQKVMQKSNVKTNFSRLIHILINKKSSWGGNSMQKDENICELSEFQ